MEDSYYYIEELMAGDQMQGHYLLKNLEQRTDRNGCPYYSGLLADRTGEIPFKIFNTNSILNLDALEPGCFVYASYEVNSWQDSLIANISLLRPVKPNEKIDIAEILPMAPISSDKMFAKLMAMTADMKNQELKTVCQILLNEHKSQLMTIPGGKSMHHNVLGGLLYHMLRMAQSGLALTAIYPEINPDLIAAGAIVHDIGKLQEYQTEPSGMIRDFTAAGDLLSHNILGILMLEKACKKANASQSTFLALSHMIESHHGAPERGSAIQPMFLEADLLHHLDMIDSRIWIFNREQSKLEPGEVSRPIKALDGSVYRPF